MRNICLIKALNPKTTRKNRQLSLQPRIEVLEDRTVPATIQWNVDTDGFWDDPANWDLNRIPNGNDTVIIDRGAANPTITVRNLEESAGTLTNTERLVVAPTGSLRASEQSFSTVGGTVILNGGWHPHQGVRFTGDLTWSETGGFGSGTVNFAGTTHLTGSVDHGVYNVTFNNEGTFLHEGSGSLVTNNFNFTFTNQPGAVYEFQSDGDINGVRFVNQGTVRKTGGTGTTFIGGQDVYTNRGEFRLEGGTVEATSGKLVLRSMNPTGGSFQVGARAVIDLLDGNQTNFFGNYTGTGSGRVELSNGTLQPSGAVFDFDPGVFHWVGGAVAYGRIDNHGAIQISGDADKAVYGGGGITNYGHVIQSGLGNVNQYSGGGGRFDNKPGGIYDIEGDSDIGGWFYNEGLFRKMSGSGETKTSTADQYGNRGGFIHLSGTVEARTGTLALGGGQDSTGGTLKPFAGAVIDFNGSMDTTFHGTYFIIGEGQVSHTHAYIFPGANFIIDATQGHFVWNSGVIYGGSFITRGDVELAGPGGKLMERCYWNIDGTVRHTGGSLYGTRNTVDINPGGVYDMQGDYTLENVVGSGQQYLLNRGLFRKSAGTGEALLNNDYTDTINGTFETLSGTLSMPRSGYFNGVNFNVAAETLINMNDRLFNAGKSYAGLIQGHGLGHVLFQATLQTGSGGPATLNFDQGVAIVGRDTYFGGEFVIQGHLTFDSPTYIQWRGGFTNQGTMDMVGPSGLNFYTGGTGFDNQGTINFLGDNNLMANSGYGFPVVFTNSGVIRKVGGTRTSKIFSEGTSGPFQLTNSGTIEALTGTLSLEMPTGALPQWVSGRLTGGTWKAGPGARLTLPNASAITNNQANIVLTGPGAIFTNISGLNRNEGTLRIDQGKSFATTSNFTNTGQLEVGANSTFQVNGALTLTGSSTVQIDITGSEVSSAYGKVNSTGATTLAGILDINLQGYGPSSSEQYPVMNYASQSGNLAAINGLDPYLSAVVNPDGVILNGQGTPPDLDVISITPPVSGTVGQSITVHYVVQNLSDTPASGVWRDAVYLSRDRILSPDDRVLGLVERTGIVDAQGTYAGHLSAIVPGLTQGDYFVIVVADAGRSLADADRSNNGAASDTATTINLGSIGVDLPANGVLHPHQPVYYRLIVPHNRPDMLLHLQATAGNSVELFAAQDRLPSTADFNFVSTEFHSNIATTLVSNPGFSTWYVMAVNRSAAASSFILSASIATPQLHGASPDVIGNHGNVTLVLRGEQLRSSDLYQLVSPDGLVISASRVTSDHARQATATFTLNQAPLGEYSIQMVRDGQAIVLPDAVTIESVREPRFTVSLALPGSYRAGLIFQGALVYRNEGNVDMVSPVLILNTGTGTRLALDRHSLQSGPSVDNERIVLAVSPTSHPGVLHPGEEARIPFWIVESAGSGVNVSVDYQTSDSTDSINWSAVSQAMKPAMVTNAEWDTVFPLFRQAVGNTWGEYVQFLSNFAGVTRHAPDKLALPHASIPDYLPSPSVLKTFETQAILEYAFNQLRADANKQVEGIVRNAGQPLSGILVRLLDSEGIASATALTDAEGKYRFPLVPNGVYSLAVEGFLLAQPVSLQLDGSAVHQDIQVMQGGVIQGTIRRNSDAALLQGYPVQAISFDGTFFTTYTDTAAKFRFTGLPAGQYTLVTWGATIAETRTAPITVAAQDVLSEVDITCPLASRLSGIVHYQGNPASQVQMTIIDSTGNAFTTSTDSNGSYVFENLHAASYTLTARNHGQVAPELAINLGVAQDAQAPTIHLQSAARLSISVRDELGAALSGAQIALIRNNQLVAYVSASDEGQLLLSDLFAGEYDLIVNADQYQTYRASITLATGSTMQHEVTLHDVIILRGTVITSLDNPVANMIVNLFTEDSQGKVHSLNTMTDAHGVYSIGLPAGAYAVTVGNNMGIRRQMVTLSNSLPAQELHFQLPGASLLGQVHSADGMTPLANAIVELRQNGMLLATATTLTDGSYFFRSLSAGQYDVRAATLNGITGTLTATVIADQDNSAPALLTGTLTLSGTVLSNNHMPLAGVVVYLTPDDGSFTSQPLSQVTDAQGQYQFDNLQAGSYQLTAQSSSWALARIQVSILQNKEQNVIMTSGFLLTGTIEHAGQPVEGAFITLLDSTNLLPIGFAVSTALGQFAVPHVASGNYHLLVSSHEHQTLVMQNVTVSSTVHLGSLALASQVTEISGTILDEQNMPLTLAQIEFLDAQGMIVASTSTDLWGSYEMKQLPAGSFTMRATLIGYRTASTGALDLPSGLPVVQHLQLITAGTDDVELSDNFTDMAIYLTTYFSGLIEPRVKEWMDNILTNAGKPQHYAGDVGFLDLIRPGSEACSEKEALYLRALDGYFRKTDAYSDWEKLYAALETTLKAGVSAYVFQVTDTLGTAFLTLRFRAAWTAFIGASNPQIAALITAQLTQFALELEHALTAPGGISDGFTFENIKATLNKLVHVKDSFGSLKSLIKPIFDVAVRGRTFSSFSFNPLGLVLKLFDLISTTSDSLNALENIKGDVQNARARYVKTVREYLHLKRAYDDHICVDPEDPDIHPTKPGPRRGLGLWFSTDPNQLQSTGVGQFGAVRQGDVISYTAHFENLPSANAAAQIVKVTLPLSSHLNWSTLQLTGIGFNDVDLVIPGGLKNYETTVISNSDPDHPVKVTISFDPVTGMITATMQSIDPLTGEATDNPVAGFLLPEDGNGGGQGYLSFDVETIDSLLAGTEIICQASIIFDANAPLLTNTSLNTIDTEAPVSQIDALPATTNSSTFTVTWSGSDPNHGAGITSYDVFVSINYGPFTLWKDDVTANSAPFTGQLGNRYSFYSRASDGLGFEEDAPGMADATIEVRANPTPTIEYISIDRGSSQRSKFIQVQVYFNTLVTIDKNAFVLYLNGKRFSIAKVQLTVENGRTVAMLQFKSTQLRSQSLPEGQYQLITFATGVNSRTSGLQMESNRTDSFFRLFGDANGDGQVDDTDAALLQSTMNKRRGQSGYLAYFDYDSNGRIDSRDAKAFNSRRSR